MKHAHDNGIATPEYPGWTSEIELEQWNEWLWVNISGEMFIGIYDSLSDEDSGKQHHHRFLFLRIDRATRSLRGIALRPIGNQQPLHVLGRWIASGTNVILRLKFLMHNGVFSDSSHIVPDKTFFNITDGLDQRCTSNNCKDWDWGAQMSGRKATNCTVCWAPVDFYNHSTWDARESYTAAEIAGSDSTTPFRLDNGKCIVQCKAGWWSNWGSKNYGTTHTLDQRCTSNNCKTWRYDLGNKASTSCEECWEEPDLADYDNWDGKASY